MKRILIGAVAAAALAMPAGAAANQADSAIPPCPNDNLSYCVKYWISYYIDDPLGNS